MHAAGTNSGRPSRSRSRRPGRCGPPPRRSGRGAAPRPPGRWRRRAAAQARDHASHRSRPRSLFAALRLRDRAAQGRRPRRERHRRPLIELSCCVRRACRPVAHRGEPHPVQAVERQGGHQPDALRGRRRVEVGHTSHESGVRGLVDDRAGARRRHRGRRPHPQGPGVVGQQRQARQQRGAALFVPAGRSLHVGTGQQQRRALLGGRVVGQQPERDVEPVRGERRRTVRERARGVAQDREGRRIPAPREALDVVGRSAGVAPRAASAIALRSCAPRRHAAGVDS